MITLQVLKITIILQVKPAEQFCIPKLEGNVYIYILLYIYIYILYIYIQVAWCHSWSCTAAKNHFLQQLLGGSQSSGSPQRREEVSSPLRACHASQILWQVQPTKKNKWGWPKTETDKERERGIYIYINRLLKTCSKLNQHRSM